MENVEIERKWLIKNVPEDIGKYECLNIEQAYLSASPTVRVRKENGDYYLTYKNISKNVKDPTMGRTEYNLPLDKESYEHLREKRDGILISKKRYLIPLKKGLKIELDVFDPPYEGLVVAEVEFESEEDAVRFTPPEWFGEDVTKDPKYKNAVMAKGWTK